MANIYMPVIEGAPAGRNAADYYRDVAAATTVTAVAAANKGLQIGVTNYQTYGKLFSMTAGTLRYIPVGQPLADGLTETATVPTLSLQVTPGAFQELSRIKDLPLVAYIFYQNINPATIRDAIELQRNEALRLPVKELLSVWTGPTPGPGQINELLSNYLDAVAAGRKGLYIRPGQWIGSIATPANAADPASCTIRMLGPKQGEIPPLRFVRAMPDHGFDGAAKWLGHPLLAASAAIQLPIEMHVRFEVWNLTTKRFEPLPAGVQVGLMDYRDGVIDDELDVQTTDATGSASFSFANLAALDPDPATPPNLFFEARVAGLSHAGHTLTNTWSTKGWRPVSGNGQGYYPAFRGDELVGQADAPLVFRVGVDVHLQLQYRHKQLGRYESAPRGVPITLRATQSASPDPLEIALRTDAKGQVHFVSFDIEAASNISFLVSFEAEEHATDDPTSIRVVNAKIYPELEQPSEVPLSWDTGVADADRTASTFFPSHTRTSIGAHDMPASLLCTVQNRDLALYCLKVLREVRFFFYTLGNSWGDEELKIRLKSETNSDARCGNPDNIRLFQNHHWARSTLAHEIGHTLHYMLMIGCQTGQGLSIHYTNTLRSEETGVFTEGWAEFIELLFTAKSEPLEDPGFLGRKNLVDEAGAPTLKPLVTAPLNAHGLRVEGAFAGFLWDVFKHYIAPGKPAFPFVPETVDGNSLSVAPWASDSAIRSRFNTMILDPMTDLLVQGKRPFKTSDMVNTMLDKNQSSRHGLLFLLNKYNMRATRPQVSAVSPSSGPAAGGQTVQLTGVDFSGDGRLTDLKILIAGKEASAVTVTSSSTLTLVTPPGSAGTYDIVVASPAGDTIVQRGYTYR